MRIIRLVLLVAPVLAVTVSAQVRPPLLPPVEPRPAARPTAPRADARPDTAAAPLPARPVRTAPALLAQRVPELRVTEMPLRDVFAALAELADVNIVVRWRRLADEGILPEQPVTLQLRNVSLETALGLLLRDATRGDVRLAYRASADLILISTADEFAAQMVVKVYDVAEILLSARRQHTYFFFGRTREYVTEVEPVVGENVGAVRPITREYNSGLEGWLYGDTHEPWSDAERARLMQQLIDAITNTIEPESWEASGGPGTIRAYGNRLIICNSPLVHQLIGGPLRERE